MAALQRYGQALCASVRSCISRVYVLLRTAATELQLNLFAMPDWATKVLTWEATKGYIEQGTVESLGHLRRSEQQLTTYRAFMAKVRQDYASTADFIKISVLDRACRIKSDGKKEAVDMEHGTDLLVWHKNDFPYYFEDDVDHWLLWSTSGPLSPAAIEQETQQKFADKDHLIFINPAALQSIRDIWHCHVLVRPRRQQHQAELQQQPDPK